MAKIYWRTIKRGTRKFSDCPVNLQAEIKELAKQDVVNKIITAAEYKNYIGEKYTA